MTLHAALLRTAALLVPAGMRDEWLAEWTAELWYVARPPLRRRTTATAFCLGAFRDALWLRRNLPEGVAAGIRPSSGLQCLLLLTAVTAAAAAPAFRLPAWSRIFLLQPSLRIHLLMIGAALLFAFVATPATVDHPAAGRWGGRGRFRGWSFFSLKIVLLTASVFFGIADVAALNGTFFQPHGFLVGYVLVYRWAVRDQHRRCPVCLRRLMSPARIGSPSNTFLEWYGTEFVCGAGHGLLQVPEISSRGYSRGGWLPLDASWSHLFSKPAVRQGQ